MATLDDIKKQLQSDRKVNEAISRGTHDTLRTNKKILAEILEHFKGIKASTAMEAADRKEQKREDATAGSKPGGSTRFSTMLPKSVKDGLGSLMGFVKKGLLIAAIPAILAFINSDYWPKFRDTMISLAKKLKTVYDDYLLPTFNFFKDNITKGFLLLKGWAEDLIPIIKDITEKIGPPIKEFFKSAFKDGMDNIKELFTGTDGQGGLKGAFEEFKKGNYLEGVKIGLKSTKDFFIKTLDDSLTNTYNLFADLFGFDRIANDSSAIKEIKEFAVGVAESLNFHLKQSGIKANEFLKETIGINFTDIKRAYDNIFSFDFLERLFDANFPEIDNPFTKIKRKRFEKTTAAFNQDLRKQQEFGMYYPTLTATGEQTMTQTAAEISGEAYEGPGGPIFGLKRVDNIELDQKKKIEEEVKRKFEEEGGTVGSKILGTLNSASEYLITNTIKTGATIKSFGDMITPESFDKAISNIFLNNAKVFSDAVSQDNENFRLTDEKGINTQIINSGDQNAYLINGATSTHDNSDPKLQYSTAGGYTRGMVP